MNNNWKIILDDFLKKNEKSFKKYETQNGAFNSCKQVSEALGERLAEKYNLDVKILRLDGFKGTLENAHKKWQKIGAEYVIHYVLLIESENIVDLTSKQFDENNPNVLIYKDIELDKYWNEYQIHKEYNICKKLNFKKTKI
jgi:hypothetical protein